VPLELGELGQEGHGHGQVDADAQPITKRAPASTYSFGASAQAMAAITKHSMSAMNTR
jgi:hypothetical protein